MALGAVILAVTVGAFVYYLARHPQVAQQLKHLQPAQLALLLPLYAVWFAALVLLMRASLAFFGKRMGMQENFLLSAYSSLVNFFGPGQSGPAARGAYLKKKHGLRIKDYLFTTLMYYGFYAVLSALLLFAGSRPWWQTALALAAVGAASAAVIWRFMRKAKVGQYTAGHVPRHVLGIFLATVLQTVMQIAIYFVELRGVDHVVSLAQVVTYTGAADFAIFLALTPGAIGIRESFLLLSQHLHHVDSASIVSANIIDRAVYIVFLGLLFVLVVSLHAKAKLRLGQLGGADKKSE